MEKIKVEPFVETREYAGCPVCGDKRQHSVGHLTGNYARLSVGPWDCKNCGAKVTLKRESETSPWYFVKCEPGIPDKKGLMLMKLAPQDKPIYLVVKHVIYSHRSERKDPEEGMEYFVEEHTCPTNLVPAEVIIEGTDTDPHGIFEFVQLVEQPEGYENKEPNGYSDWTAIFDRLPHQDIEGQVVQPMKRIN